MGGIDKQELLFGGERLGPRAARLLSGHFDEVIVVTGRPGLYEGGRLRFTRDLLAGRGPLGGIHAALKAASSEWVYVMACDMPRFSPDYEAFVRKRLLSVLGGPERGLSAPVAAVTRFGRHIEPFHAYYSRSLVPAIESLLGALPAGCREPSIRDLIEGLSCEWIQEEEARRFSPDWSLFANINEPGDLSGLEPASGAS
jgi:molybdopterin-guanine dinucleotide biosynthesis protein A